MVPYEITRDITTAVNNRTTAIGSAQGICERGAGVDLSVNEDAERTNNAEMSKSRSSCVTTIGIGSGPYTNGQVLVTDDMLGRYNLINPKFLRRYARQYDETMTAVQAYVKDVRAEEFPQISESYSQKS
jgi:ketopantoate hydroxymethyltransferase